MGGAGREEPAVSVLMQALAEVLGGCKGQREVEVEEGPQNKQLGSYLGPRGYIGTRRPRSVPWVRRVCRRVPFLSLDILPFCPSSICVSSSTKRPGVRRPRRPVPSEPRAVQRCVRVFSV